MSGGVDGTEVGGQQRAGNVKIHDLTLNHVKVELVMLLLSGVLRLVRVHLPSRRSGQAHSPNLLSWLLQLSHENCAPLSNGVGDASLWREVPPFLS